MGWGGYSVRSGHDNGTRRGELLSKKYPNTRPKKTVFDVNMVIHVWAQQKQQYGRNAKGSIYFDGPTLYSYGAHFPMASFASPDVVLFNAKESTNTTSEHQRKAWHSVKDKRRFEVQNPLASTPEQHAENLAAIVSAAEDALEIATRARSGFRQRIGAISRARTCADRAHAYQREFFPRKRKAPITLPDLAPFERMAQLAESRVHFLSALGSLRDVKLTPVNVRRVDDVIRATRSALFYAAVYKRLGGDWGTKEFNPSEVFRLNRKAQAIARKAKRVIPAATYHPSLDHNMATCLDVSPSSYSEETDALSPDIWKKGDYRWKRGYSAFDEFARTFKTETERRAARLESEENSRRWAAERLERERRAAEERAEREALRNAPLTERVVAWRDGRAVDIGHESACMLRLKGDDVQTSWGATFPAEHARRAWPLIRAVYAAGKAWRTNGHKIPLGHFQVDSIDTDGTLTAGCHTLARSEIENCARLLGLAVD